MKDLLASLSIRQRITIVVVALAACAGVLALVHRHKENGFRPLFTGLSAEDAGAIVQKLKEGGVEYRLPENGGIVLVPTERIPELRLNMASAGLPKTGRIGFELFDKTNFGATEFTEHVNYRRALEGELERSVMSLAEVEQARVHLTFPKESVFLEAQQPAKASVLVKVKSGSRLMPQNVLAINHLVASAVEGLSPDRVSVLDMNGNLLGRPRNVGSLDGPEPSEATLDFRRKVESDLLTKINSTLEPLLGPEKFRAAVSVECNFTGGEQSEETYDPSRTVMLSQERTEDFAGTASSSGVPGTASNLPRPTSKSASSSGKLGRVTENITFQTSRTVKRTRLPLGGIQKMSVSVLVDHALSWDWDQKSGMKRILTPPAPEKLKSIRELVAGVTGLDQDRGDQLIVESLPFDATLNLPAPPPPAAPVPVATPAPRGTLPQLPPWLQNLNRNQMIAAGAGAVGFIVLLFTAALMMRRRRRKKAKVQVAGPAFLPGQPEKPAIAAAAADGAQAQMPAVAAGNSVEKQLEAQLAEREALQAQADTKMLDKLKLAPVITKAGEVLAKHLRETIKKDPEVTAHILRAWIREEDL